MQADYDQLREPRLGRLSRPAWLEGSLVFGQECDANTYWVFLLDVEIKRKLWMVGLGDHLLTTIWGCREQKHVHANRAEHYLGLELHAPPPGIDAGSQVEYLITCAGLLRFGVRRLVVRHDTLSGHLFFLSSQRHWVVFIVSCRLLVAWRSCFIRWWPAHMFDILCPQFVSKTVHKRLKPRR